VIVDHFSLVHELLDEVVDSGSPQTLDSAALSEYKYQEGALQIREPPFTNCESRLRRITKFPPDLSTRWVAGRGSACPTVGVHQYTPKCMRGSPPGPWDFSVAVSKAKKINSGPSVWLGPSAPI
jgi:hypothetical protein